MAEEQLKGVTRRHLLQMLTAAGIAAPAAADILAASPPKISPEILRSAETVLGEHFTDERLQVIDKALQRNLDQFQMVRDFVIDDLVEPAPIFMAKGW